MESGPLRAAAGALALVAVTLPARAGDPPAPAGFDASIPLEVRAERPGEEPRLLGTTPSADGEGIRVPRGGLWWVRPRDAVLGPEAVRRLVSELRPRRVAGLSLRGRFLDPASFPRLLDLDGLRWLDLAGSNLGPEDLPLFRNCRRLEFLDLSGLLLKGRDLEALAPFPLLRTLRLGGSRGGGGVRGPDLAPLAGLRRLRSLALPGREIGMADLVDLHGLTSLRELDLSGSGLDAAGLARLAWMEGLERLDFRNCEALRRAPLSPLKALTRLRQLDLSGIGLRDADLAALAAMPSLERLVLRGSREITDGGLARLAALPRLRSLDLSMWDGTAVCGTCGAVAARWEGLAPSRITSRGLRTLGGIPTLRELDLSGRPFPPEAVDRLQARLPRCAIAWKPPR